jgi:hypothetical protein
MPSTSPDFAPASLLADVPAGVAAAIRNYLSRDPLTFNTDWAGTMPMWGLAMWARRGVPECLDYVKAWFEAHLARDPRLSDEELLKTYCGHASRVIRGQHLPFTMYCGQFGLNFPCSELFLQAGDERARQVCIDVADAIVYRARRNRFGQSAHDDDWEYDIPDACFFTVEPLMRAAAVDPEGGRVYVRAAVTQLRAYVDVFLNRGNGLAHTVLGPRGIGKTFWCRAQGWLMWSFLAVLRGLPKDHPDRDRFLEDLSFFAAGVAKTVDEDGAIHAFANDPASLAETTGTAMVCLSLHESVRRGWLDRGAYAPLIQRMWAFVQRHVTDEGSLEKVYYEWALPAELYVESSKTVQFGPHIGALLWLAEEMTTGEG